LVGFTDPTLHRFGEWFGVIDENIIEMPMTYPCKFSKQGYRDASILVGIEPLHVLCEFTLA
jgi:hypothetical protein